ncbi:uncharacterized protein TNCV_323441 [Trichonephila clavipes]|nr:uncharacterized protein TNCV_323441 [Trichonephila clavipes]
MDRDRFIDAYRNNIDVGKLKEPRYRIVTCLVTSSSPVPQKNRRVGQRCTLNLSRAETSSSWCGVVVRRGGVPGQVSSPSLDHGSKLRSPAPKAFVWLNSVTLIFKQSIILYFIACFLNGGTEVTFPHRKPIFRVRSRPESIDSRRSKICERETPLDDVVAAAVSFPKGRNESCQSLRQVGLLDNRWRHRLSPPPQFRHGTGGEGNVLHPLAPMVSAAATHKTFGLTNLTRSYSVCTRRVFGGIEPRLSCLKSDALIPRLSTAPPLDGAINKKDIILGDVVSAKAWLPKCSPLDKKMLL